MRHPRAGFTMIEFLISAFITSIVFLIGFSTITMTQNAQNTATVNLRIAENVRLFFDTLERDLNGAYPAGYASMSLNSAAAIRLVDTPAVAQPINQSDALHFFTKTDHARTPDSVCLVRYYVARNAANDAKQANPDRTMLCREVLTGYLIEQTNDFVTPPAIDPAAGAPSALFDGVKKMKISYRRWVPEAKQFDPSLSSSLDGDPATATHLLVRLYMLDPNPDPTRVDTAATLEEQERQRARSYRLFQKVIPIPQSFLK